MEDIYRSASEVLLFPSTINGDLGVAYGFILQFCSEFVIRFLTMRDGFKNVWQKPTTAELTELIGISSPDHACRKAVRYSVERPYFRRTWIVQEVALATKLRLVFGAFNIDLGNDRSLSFTSFSNVVSYRNHKRAGRGGLYIGTGMVYPRALVLGKVNGSR
jgi:hypothetical protein